MTQPPTNGPPEPGPTELPETVMIHLGNVLGPEWIDWFGGGEILDRRDGTSSIRVQVRDQAMLFGFLIRIRDLGIPLLGLYPHRAVAGEGETGQTPGGGPPPGATEESNRETRT